MAQAPLVASRLTAVPFATLSVLLFRLGFLKT